LPRALGGVDVVFDVLDVLAPLERRTVKPFSVSSFAAQPREMPDPTTIAS
jgi:hypothetical protein